LHITMDEKKSPMQRRLKFSMLILVSQILLIALAISWLIHMVTIAVAGSVYFIENNPIILWSEITISLLITLFAVYIAVIQIRKLGERRPDDRRR
jgi:uncharacterized BrkB/YihY/UPF0761 family membrane protein